MSQSNPNIHDQATNEKAAIPQKWELWNLTCVCLEECLVITAWVNFCQNLSNTGRADKPLVVSSSTLAKEILLLCTLALFIFHLNMTISILYLRRPASLSSLSGSCLSQWFCFLIPYWSQIWPERKKKKAEDVKIKTDALPSCLCELQSHDIIIFFI